MHTLIHYPHVTYHMMYVGYKSTHIRVYSILCIQPNCVLFGYIGHLHILSNGKHGLATVQYVMIFPQFVLSQITVSSSPLCNMTLMPTSKWA